MNNLEQCESRNMVEDKLKKNKRRKRIRTSRRKQKSKKNKNKKMKEEIWGRHICLCHNLELETLKHVV